MSGLGLDRSGNSNHWSTNNITIADQVVDSPTNNFATLNPLWQDSSITLQEGNLRSSRNANMNRPSQSTISLGTGKWYFEALDQYTTGNQIGVEWEGADVETHVHTSGIKAYTWNSSGSTYAEGVYDGGGSAGSVASGARIRMVAYDGSTGKLWGGANGTWGSSGNPAAGTNESMTVPADYRDKMHFVVATENSSTSQGIVANFGQDSSFAGLKTAQGNQDGNDIGDFYYTPPTGFLALCTKNLPDVAVTPSEHFNTILFTGNGTDDRSITGVGFAPDLSWLKARPANSGHNLSDTVRGDNKILASHTTAAESTLDTIVSLDSDGFTVGDGNGYDVNKNGESIVAWNWKAGTSVSGNSSGSGTAQSYTGSVNIDAGFSIIKYTGNGTDGMQVPHHLGVVPDAIFIKSLTTQSWNCFFPNAIGADKGLQLDNSGPWGGPFHSTHLSDDMPTTSVVKLGNGAATNTFADGVGQDYIMYCWANKDGHLKAGGYVGNGNADGTFVYTGFRPAFLIVKVTGLDGERWFMYDNKRDPENIVDTRLAADGSVPESTGSSQAIDFLSNGFKARANQAAFNSNAYTYVYLCMAETPFKYSNAR